MDTFKQLIKEALTPEFLKEGIDAEGALDNLDKWLPNLSPGPFHFYDIIDDGDIDEMVDLIRTYGDEEVLGDYGINAWDKEDIIQLANYIVSRGNKETDLIPQGKMPLHLKQELDQEYFDDFELKDHPDKKDEFYALLLKHVPKGDFGHLRREVGELFGFTNVAPGSNAGEMIEYFRNLVLRGLDIQFKSSQANEVVGLGDSQPKDDDEDPDDRPAHEAGSFATNEEIELSSLVDKDRMKDAAMEGTMRGLVGKVNKMMEISAKIERTLRREPELDFKVRDTEMLLRHLNHQLSVLKEKFKF